jgi:hypothetical protein
VVSFTPRLLYLRGKGQQYLLDWTPKPVWTIWRSENSWPYRDTNSYPSVVQPEASRYTDCTTEQCSYLEHAHTLSQAVTLLVDARFVGPNLGLDTDYHNRTSSWLISKSPAQENSRAVSRLFQYHLLPDLDTFIIRQTSRHSETVEDP